MNKIIAVDFDGTLFTNAWPNVGEPIFETINALKKEKADGADIILWTNRVDDKLQEAIEACRSVGIEFDAVNENLPRMVEFFGGDPRKIFANEYWDDRAITASYHGLKRFGKIKPYHDHGIGGAFWRCGNCHSILTPYGIRCCSGCGSEADWHSVEVENG